MSDATERLQRILEDAYIGVWLMHVPTGALSPNSVFHRMIGCREGEIGHGLHDSAWVKRMHPADLPVVMAWRARLMAGEIDGFRADYRMRRDEGGWNTLRSRIHIAERDADGKPLWISGVIIDVSAERELDRRLHALFDRPFQFIGLLTPEGVLIETNRASLQQSGHRLEEVIGKLFWDGPFFRNSPDVQDRLRWGVARAAAGQIVRFEIQHPDSSGVQRTVDFTLTPLRDDDGKVVNIIPEGRDITELASAREALRAAERRLTIATSNANLGLWDWDPDTDQAWFNDQWYTMLGYQPGELPAIGQTWVSLLHPDDAVRCKASLAEHLAGRTPDYRSEFRLRRKDGSYRWMLTQARMFEHGEHGKSRRLSGVHTDITERKEMELQLASAQRLESIGHLAAGVAHEINTPVQYVGDSLYFIREGVQELLRSVDRLRTRQAMTPEQEAELLHLRHNLPVALDRALDGLGRVTEIVRSMREFSHPDQHEMSPIDLNRAIQSTLVVAKNEYKYVAEVVTDLGELPQVHCHGGEINQVVLNLVVNAAHAIAEVVRGTDRKGQIRVTTRHDGKEAVISVADTGTGIPEHIRGRVFDQFFTTKEVGKGTGQGLAIVRNIVVRRHGGRLSFQTEPNRGTTFFVHLPLHPAARLDGVDVA
ncbi:MAG TPA: PAS domain-containing protein [Steroidobacteraceae bacterium]|nr:PAS domain-containing protein [Steroidobacteraceae bacterium]